MILVHIREATTEDNEQLIQLQRKCPMGSDLLLQLDSSPDFYNRSKGYEDWNLLVAEEDEQIVGSAGFALQDKTISGSLYRGIYEYGFMVNPDYRRRGIATLLQEKVERRAQEKEADFLHLNITEDNVASHGLFTHRGFKPIRQCSPLMFMAYKKHATDHYKIRPMKEGDIPVVVTLLNEYNRDSDFYTPLTTESFVEHFNRLPFYAFEDIFLYEYDTVKAVAGYWDYSRVMRFTLQSYNTRWKIMAKVADLIGKVTPMPKLPGVGEQMTNWYLTPFAYRDPEAAKQLIMHILNIAAQNQVSMVSLPVDRENHAYSTLDKLKPNKGSFTWYIKPLRDLPEIKQIYIDPLDV
jgi:GNAT superfamily N-acetyltransferase